MLKQKVFVAGTTALTRVDLVKGYRTKARIYGVMYCITPSVDIITPQRVSLFLSYMDYDTQEAAGLEIAEDETVFSQFQIATGLDTTGANGFQTHYRDYLFEPIDIVCPISLYSYRSTGSANVYTRIFYEILVASSDEIIKIAALQGLQMEV